MDTAENFNESRLPVKKATNFWQLQAEISGGKSSGFLQSRD